MVSGGGGDALALAVEGMVKGLCAHASTQMSVWWCAVLASWAVWTARAAAPDWTDKPPVEGSSKVGRGVHMCCCRALRAPTPLAAPADAAS